MGSHYYAKPLSNETPCMNNSFNSESYSINQNISQLSFGQPGCSDYLRNYSEDQLSHRDLEYSDQQVNLNSKISLNKFESECEKFIYQCEKVSRKSKSHSRLDSDSQHNLSPCSSYSMFSGKSRSPDIRYRKDIYPESKSKRGRDSSSFSSRNKVKRSKRNDSKSPSTKGHYSSHSSSFHSDLRLHSVKNSKDHKYSNKSIEKEKLGAIIKESSKLLEKSSYGKEESLRYLRNLHEEEFQEYRKNPKFHPFYFTEKKRWDSHMKKKGFDLLHHAVVREWDKYFSTVLDKNLIDSWKEKEDKLLKTGNFTRDKTANFTRDKNKNSALNDKINKKKLDSYPEKDKFSLVSKKRKPKEHHENYRISRQRCYERKIEVQDPKSHKNILEARCTSKSYERPKKMIPKQSSRTKSRFRESKERNVKKSHSIHSNKSRVSHIKKDSSIDDYISSQQQVKFNCKSLQKTIKFSRDDGNEFHSLKQDFLGIDENENSLMSKHKKSVKDRLSFSDRSSSDRFLKPSSVKDRLYIPWERKKNEFKNNNSKNSIYKNDSSDMGKHTQIDSSPKFDSLIKRNASCKSLSTEHSEYVDSSISSYSLISNNKNSEHISKKQSDNSKNNKRKKNEFKDNNSKNSIYKNDSSDMGKHTQIDSSPKFDSLIKRNASCKSLSTEHSEYVDSSISSYSLISNNKNSEHISKKQSDNSKNNKRKKNEFKDNNSKNSIYKNDSSDMGKHTQIDSSPKFDSLIKRNASWKSLSTEHSEYVDSSISSYSLISNNKNSEHISKKQSDNSKNNNNNKDELPENNLKSELSNYSPELNMFFVLNKMKEKFGLFSNYISDLFNRMSEMHKEGKNLINFIDSDTEILLIFIKEKINEFSSDSEVSIIQKAIYLETLGDLKTFLTKVKESREKVVVEVDENKSNFIKEIDIGSLSKVVAGKECKEIINYIKDFYKFQKLDHNREDIMNTYLKVKQYQVSNEICHNKEKLGMKTDKIISFNSLSVNKTTNENVILEAAPKAISSLQKDNNSFPGKKLSTNTRVTKTSEKKKSNTSATKFKTKAGLSTSASHKNLDKQNIKNDLQNLGNSVKSLSVARSKNSVSSLKINFKKNSQAVVESVNILVDKSFGGSESETSDKNKDEYKGRKKDFITDIHSLKQLISMDLTEKIKIYKNFYKYNKVTQVILIKYLENISVTNPEMASALKKLKCERK